MTSRTQRAAARIAAATLTAAAATALLLAGGAGAARADDPGFRPGDTDAAWDGAVATVTFREAGLPPEADMTTISAEVTVAVDAVCRRGASVLRPHRAATALDVRDYPVAGDGTVDGVATVPLEVAGLQVTGYTCTTARVSIRAVLEDFWTGATLVHET